MSHLHHSRWIFVLDSRRCDAKRGSRFSSLGKLMVQWSFGRVGDVLGPAE